jgi:A/G-specific adenine glycosylase
MDRRYFSEKLVEWYVEHRRDLPWRDTDDPYNIWLSEIILQQTRVIQGLPYYLKFVEKYPDVKSLATASEEEILRLWQGLGYYSRARNLHKCAKEVMLSFEGRFPNHYADLLTLPGIGEYTAAAIASFSAKEKVAVVDGNVFRVLARIHGETTAINSPEGKKLFFALANDIIPENNPDVFNQAIMEFGALWCTPKQPRCTACPFASSCFAATNGLQSDLPVKIPARKSRKRYFNYFVVKKGNSILMKRREGKDIWHGLYDFYLVETPRSIRPEKLIRSDKFLQGIETKNLKASENYRHVLSHQTIISKFVVMEEGHHSIAAEDSLKYYPIKKIHDLPKPVLISRFLEDYNFL